jgi:hypothetical protein
MRTRTEHGQFRFFHRPVFAQVPDFVLSRLGLEPRALALKAPRLMKKINAMNLPNRPMSDRHLQRVTASLSYIGQSQLAFDLRFTNREGKILITLGDPTEAKYGIVSRM